MPKKYIGEKFENSTWYHMYYDESLKMMSLVEHGDDLEFLYDLKEEDKVAIAFIKDQKRIINARKAKMYEEKFKQSLKRDFYVLVFAVLSGVVISKLSEPITQYNIKYIVSEEESRDELALDYVREVIDENETINKEFKKYLLSFFKKLYHLDYSFNRDSVSRMLDNIQSKDYSNVSFASKESMVLGLAEVISDQNEISVVMASLEYYEQYEGIEASYKSRLFDAINARTDDTLLSGIIDGGDKYYKDYLCNKYGITEDKANEVIVFMKSIYIGYKYDNDEDYINSILAFNYNFGDNYLYGLDELTNYDDLANGKNRYSYNLYDSLIKLTISDGENKYDTYYDTENSIDVTSSEYFKKFDELVSNFDSNIDVKDSSDRMLLYLYTIASLKDEVIYQDRSSYVFSLGEEYFDEDLYSYLSGNDYDVEIIINVIVGLAYSHDLDEDDLKLLNEVLIAVNEEKELGKVTPYFYEVIFKDLAYRINDTFDKKTSLEWQDNVISLVEPDGIPDIINKYRDSVIRLTKREN